MRSSFARESARLRRARAVGLQWRTYAGFAGGALLVLVVFALIGPFTGSAVLEVLALLGCAAGLIFAVRRFDDPQIAIQVAQDKTAKLAAKLDGWRPIGTLRFESADVEQVVISPSAVLAVHTGWYPVPLDAAAEQHELGADVARATAAAETVRSFVRGSRLQEHVEVLAVVVLQGDGAPVLPDGFRKVSGSYLVDGQRPEAWQRCFAEASMSAATRQRLFDAFADFIDERDAYVAANQPWIARRLVDEVLDGIAQERSDRLHARSKGLLRRHVTP